MFTPLLSTTCLIELLLLVATEKLRRQLIATRLNVVLSSSATSFSSFVTRNTNALIYHDLLMNYHEWKKHEYIFFNFVPVFFLLYYLAWKIFISQIWKYITLIVNQISAREPALWWPFLVVQVRPFYVRRWKGRVLWGKKWMEKCSFPAVVGISALVLTH